jgi:TolB-like protein
MAGFRPSQGTVRFGAFELDQDAGELRKDGIKVRLQEQPFQMLQILLQRPGEVVTREELQQKIWPSDTFVDFDHGINNSIKRLREALGDTAETPRYVETLPRRGYRFLGDLKGGARHIQSLLVLPLENLSRDPEQEYFADGMTEALITNLAKISALQVVSRTTAMHYKGIHRPLPELARELGVDGIVEGTVMRSGKRVRISAQLVDAHSDRHLWAEDYDRDLRDILALQSEVAQAIAREVQITLTPRDRERLARTRPVNPEAYEAYERASPLE